MRVFFGAGAEIPIAEKSRSYIGQTPCKAKIECDEDMRFGEIKGVRFYNKMRPPVAMFMCEPPADSTNFFKQAVIYNGASFGHPPDKVPDAIFFDMKRQ